jgi:hypothetical protein
LAIDQDSGQEESGAMILKILDNRILYFNPGRSLEFGKLNQFYHFMDHHPGVTGGRIHRFSDYSAILRMDMDPESIQAISDIRSVTTATQRPSKAVIFSSQPLGFDIANMFATYFISGPVQLRAMRDLDEALAWLGAGDLKDTILELGPVI